MEITNPSYLWGLLALLIPIAIHLFEWKKRKKVYFSNTAFLAEVQQKQNKNSRLKHLLILLSRCLAIIAMVIALSQPYFPSYLQNNAQTFIYIDNSPSMSIAQNNSSNLQNAIQEAYRLLQNTPYNAKIGIIDNSTQQITPPQRIKEVEDQLSQIAINSTSISLQTLSEKLNQSFPNQVNRVICFTDQDSIFNSVEDHYSDTQNVFYLKKEASFTPIAYLDSLWLKENVNHALPEETVFFALKNSSNTDQTLNVRLRNHQNIVGQKSIEIKRNSTVIDSLFFESTNGSPEYELTISNGRNSLFSSLYFTLSKPQLIKTFTDYPAPNKVTRALAKEPLFETVETADEADIIISSSLNESAIENYLDQGKTVLFDISTSTNPQFDQLDLKLALEKDTQNIEIYNTNAKWLKQIIKPNSTLGGFAPVFTHNQIKHFPIGSEIWLSNEFKEPLLLDIPHKTGKLFVSTLPLFEINPFTQHILYLPILFEMSFSNFEFRAPYYLLDQNTQFRTQTTNAEHAVQLIQQNQTFIPKQKKIGNQAQISLSDLPLTAGYAQVAQDSIHKSVIGLNYSRRELGQNTSAIPLSDHFHINPIDSETILSSTFSKNKDLWPIFILICLIFLAIEIILIRILK